MGFTVPELTCTEFEIDGYGLAADHDESECLVHLPSGDLPPVDNSNTEVRSVLLPWHVMRPG